MAPEQQPPQKRRRLPFKPPRTVAGPSTSASVPATESAAKSKPTAKVTKKKTNNTNAVASTSKFFRKQTSASSRQKPPRSKSPAAGSGSQSGSEANSGSDSEIINRERSLSEEPDYILAEITNMNQSDDVLSSEPSIPQKLLTRLLHHHFQKPKTKIAKDANEVVAKYVDVFVREALARAAYERAESTGNGRGRTSIGDGFLEVEDLEKMAPQLALDF